MAASRAGCTSNLKQIGVAMFAYHDIYKCFPPAFVTDREGKPAHSWRVLLLPFFDEHKTQQLYEHYKFDEPWNGPHNSQLAEKIAAVYRCPSSQGPPTSTCYVAVVGPGTMWPGTASVRLREIVDGANCTIAVVETADPNYHCLEPRDMTLGRASQGVQPEGVSTGFSSDHQHGANALLADGSVHFLQQNLPPEIVLGMLTIGGGESDKWQME